ncbi:kynurenine/alpha-aminoadipate aminotransferase, mitochondrial-like [Sceloporus undulatus]|uniref:kynurenine/alpha-aminoadipate aminotransferase, mitochondrial-like n=1 Tax=Sceloporus undulatus TaxID=8520 RepID=UPI001C4D4EDA|nr:kynurenine/alpha-aminoadipate aminotransferase, mitochondrial-like [Sceloporus undulatus]
MFSTPFLIFTAVFWQSSRNFICVCLIEMDYSRFLTTVSKSRRTNPARITNEISKKMASLIMLSGGMPNADYFPFKSASISLIDGTTIEIGEELMKKALQYSAADGIHELLAWLEELQMKIHNPPTAHYTPEKGKMKICITTGSQDGLSKVWGIQISLCLSLLSFHNWQKKHSNF